MQHGVVSSLLKDPFRLCFPVALFFAAFACVQWIGFGLFSAWGYPGQSHATLFVGGFLYYAIFGFLMTAIPRFTKTEFLSVTEGLLLGVHIAASLVMVSLGLRQVLFWATLALGWPLLFFFGGRRFLRRSENPPFTFVFVFIGVLCGLCGSAVMAIAEATQSSGALPASVQRLGHVLFFDGMALSMILGVGGRLVPGLRGLEAIVAAQRQIYESPKPFLEVVPKTVWAAALLFLASFFVEVFVSLRWGLAARALVVSYFAFAFWRLHMRVQASGWFVTLLTLCCWNLLLSSWLLVWVSDVTAAKHLVYIAGFSFLTLAIAGRVTLAHADSTFEIETRRFPFLVVGSLFGLAALTRLMAAWSAVSYVQHLSYAAVLFLLGLAIWGFVFVPKMLAGVVSHPRC